MPLIGAPLEIEDESSGDDGTEVNVDELSDDEIEEIVKKMADGAGSLAGRGS